MGKFHLIKVQVIITLTYVLLLVSGQETGEFYTRLVQTLANFGRVADVLYNVTTLEPMEESKDLDLRQKLWLVIHISNENSNKALATLIRRDNIIEESPLTDKIKIQDSSYACIWKNYAGWPVPLRLTVYPNGTKKSIEYVIPANVHTDIYQFEIDNQFEPVISKPMDIPRYVFQIISWIKPNGEHWPFIIKATSLTRIMNPNYQLFIVGEHLESVMTRVLYLDSKDSLSIDLVFDEFVFREKFKHVSQDELNNQLELQMNHSWIKAIRHVQPFAFKADIFRFFILYYFGGVYMDCPMTTHQPLDAWLPTKGSVFCKEADGLRGIFNGFIATKQKEVFLSKSLDRIVYNVQNRLYKTRDLQITGPMLLYDVYEEDLSNEEKAIVDEGLTMEFLKGNQWVLREIKDSHNPLVLANNSEYRREFSNHCKCRYGHLWNQRCVYYERICNPEVGIIG